MLFLTVSCQSDPTIRMYFCLETPPRLFYSRPRTNRTDQSKQDTVFVVSKRVLAKELRIRYSERFRVRAPPPAPIAESQEN